MEAMQVLDNSLHFEAHNLIKSLFSKRLEFLNAFSINKKTENVDQHASRITNVRQKLLTGIQPGMIATMPSKACI